MTEDIIAAMSEQHPRNEDGSYRAHCVRCGTYGDDEATLPAADFLCDECQEED